MERDRNFDDLLPKFRRKVYGGLKGEIRLAVLEKDLGEFFPQLFTPDPQSPLHILDAGGGYGPFSILLARLGHHITLCDLSEKMLEFAGECFAKQGLSDRLTLCHSPIQDLKPVDLPPFDLVLCHAVLEWVADPEKLLDHLMHCLAPSAMLSLTFYNLNGMIYKNLLRTNYKKIQDKAYEGFAGSLTPTWPRSPDQVLSWLGPKPFEILCHSGIRVFHDYILDMELKEKAPKTVTELELEFSRQLPFRDLGRYQHILGVKTKT